jgi:AMP nucleosidase
VSVDFSDIPDRERAGEIARLCDAMEEAGKAGRYPLLSVERPWSAHNPLLEGEFASPQAIRWYLERELGRLAAWGARISVSPGREALDLRDPRLGPAVDETRWDLRRKKLFLFGPERMALSIDGCSTTRGPRPSRSSGTCCSPTTPGTWRSSAPPCPTAPGRIPTAARCPPATTRCPAGPA